MSYSFIEKGIEVKFDKPAQFPKDEIVNDGERRARAWVSVEVKDKQGDTVPMEEFRRTMSTWMKRGAPITDSHTNRVVGKGLAYREKEHPKTGKPAIELDYMIYDDYKIDDKVWGEIKSGKRTGLSIGGQNTEKTETKLDDDGQLSNHLRGVELFEIASVGEPANQYAQNTAINFMAKGDKSNDNEKLLDDLRKGYDVKDINKPFGGFDNFGVCVAAQQERGHSVDSARRICGWLKYKTEKQFMGDGFDKGDIITLKDLEKSDDYKLLKADIGPGNYSILYAGERFYVTEDDKLVWRSRPFMSDNAIKMTEKITKIDKISKFIELMNDDDSSNKTTKESDSKQSDTEEIKPKAEKGKMEEINMAEDDSKPCDKEEKPEDKKPDFSGRMDALEEKFSKLVGKVDKMLTKMDEEDKDKKKEDPVEDEKKEEPSEDKPKEPKDVEEKKKDIEGEAEVLPKASAGEADETAKPSVDSLNMTEKELKKMLKENTKEIIKSLGLERTTTDRAGEVPQEIKKSKPSGMDAYDLVVKARKWETSPADIQKGIKKINRENEDMTREFIKKELDKMDGGK